MREDADRIILRNTVFSEDNYWDYWDRLLRKNPSSENDLLHTWQQAAERESRQRLRRFLLISMALLALLGGIVGEQLGLWSLRAVVDRAVEMVRQRVALMSGIAAAPEAGGGRDEGRQVAPLARRTLPTATSSNERANAGTAVPPAPQEPTRRGKGTNLWRRLGLSPVLLLPSCRVASCLRWVGCSLWVEQKSWPSKKWSLCVREIHCREFSPKNMGNIPKLS